MSFFPPLELRKTLVCWPLPSSIQSANPSLCLTEICASSSRADRFIWRFKWSRERTQGRTIYDLDDGVWNIPELRLLLEKIVPEHGVMEGFEVEREFPRLGRRSMLLNARQVFYEGNGHTTILLGLEDVTERRRTERAAGEAPGAEGDVAPRDEPSRGELTADHC